MAEECGDWWKVRRGRFVGMGAVALRWKEIGISTASLEAERYYHFLKFKFEVKTQLRCVFYFSDTEDVILRQGCHKNSEMARIKSRLIDQRSHPPQPCRARINYHMQMSRPTHAGKRRKTTSTKGSYISCDNTRS